MDKELKEMPTVTFEQIVRFRRKALDRIAELERQLSDLSKDNSEVKAQGIREVAKEFCFNTTKWQYTGFNPAEFYYSFFDEYADNLIKENKGE